MSNKILESINKQPIIKYKGVLEPKDKFEYDPAQVSNLFIPDDFNDTFTCFSWQGKTISNEPERRTVKIKYHFEYDSENNRVLLTGDSSFEGISRNSVSIGSKEFGDILVEQLKKRNDHTDSNFFKDGKKNIIQMAKNDLLENSYFLQDHSPFDKENQETYAIITHENGNTGISLKPSFSFINKSKVSVLLDACYDREISEEKAIKEITYYFPKTSKGCGINIKFINPFRSFYNKGFKSAGIFSTLSEVITNIGIKSCSIEYVKDHPEYHKEIKNILKNKQDIISSKDEYLTNAFVEKMQGAGIVKTKSVKRQNRITRKIRL